MRHQNKPSSVRHPWELARLEVILDIFKKNTKNTEDIIILDIGCGDTFFVEKFSEYFPSVNFIAIDTAFDEETIRSYTKRLEGKRIKVFDSLDHAIPAIDKKVSAVFLFDVVEHIEDDLSFLTNLSKQPNISADTLIYITVPAFQSLFTSHDVFLGHYRRYTNSSLKKVIHQSGFDTTEEGYFFFSLLPPRILQLLKEKITGRPDNPTTDVVEWRGGKFITGIIKFILFADYKIISVFKKAGISVFGLSNYAICKKSAL